MCTQLEEARAAKLEAALVAGMVVAGQVARMAGQVARMDVAATTPCPRPGG